MSNINSADKFAECPHDCYDIRVNSDVVGNGAGRWYSGEGNGDGIQDIKDGSGYAKGYSDCSNISLNHYISNRY